jgi:hypothetical protein
MHNEIKILRLQDGEDIIASYHIDESKMVVMNSPMSLFFKRISSGKSMVMMAPWLPLELIGENTAKLYETSVLTIIEPKKSLVDYYLSAVEDSNEMIKMNADAIDEALLNDSNEDDEFEYEDDDDCEIEQVQNSIKDSKKTLLH